MSHAMSIESTDGSFFASYDEMTEEGVMSMARMMGISTKGKTKSQVAQEIQKRQRKAKSSKKPEKKPEVKTPKKKSSSHSKKAQRGDPRFVQGLANSGLLG